MDRLTRARARRSAPLLAAVAVAAVLAGCSATGATTSSVTAKGTTLDIWISEPPAMTAAQRDVVDAERLAFTQHKGEVADFGLRLITVKRPQLSDNARAAIQDQSAIAYLGELAPGTTDQTAGITNAQDLLTVSPTDTALELTQSTPAIPNAPGKYYESTSVYGRTFARVVPSSAQTASFVAHLAASLKATSLFVADDGSDYGKAIAHAVRVDAAAASVTVTGAESGAGAIFYGAASPQAAASFFDHAATVAPSAKLLGPSSLDSPAFFASLSAPARAAIYVAAPGLASLPGAATFFKAFQSAWGHEPAAGSEAVFGYEAMNDVLDAIAQAGASGNDRSKVLKRFLALHNPKYTVLPSYSIRTSGNTTLSSFIVVRPAGSAGPQVVRSLSTGG